MGIVPSFQTTSEAGVCYRRIGIANDRPAYSRLNDNEIFMNFQRLGAYRVRIDHSTVLPRVQVQFTKLEFPQRER